MMLTPCLSLGHAGAHLLLPSVSFIFVGPLSSSWRVFSSVVVVVFVIILHCCRYRYRRRVVIGIRFMLALGFPIGFRRQFELAFGLSLCWFVPVSFIVVSLYSSLYSSSVGVSVVALRLLVSPWGSL